MTTLPYGLRDVKIRPISSSSSDGSDSVGSGVDLPVSRTLSFSDTEEFQELRGDDRVQASHGNGSTVEWSLESGGISLAAYAVMAGGSVTTTGTGATLRNVYKKKSSHSRPYFQIEGQSISDSGGDFHTLIYRCKADGSLEGEQADGAFWLTKASGKGYGRHKPFDSSDGDVYDFIENATTKSISDSTHSDDMTPATGPAAGGTSVAIHGGSFTGATSVTFGGIAATGLTVDTDLQITCISPAHAAGVVPVVVTTPNGVSDDTLLFTYV